MEWDPATGAELAHDFVEVGPGGTVESWTWVPTPSEQHPLPHPFAFAFIRLDGATTPLLHAVDAGAPERMVRRTTGGAPLERNPRRSHRRHRLLRPRRDARDRGGRHRRGPGTGAAHGLPGVDHLPEPRPGGHRSSHARLPRVTNYSACAAPRAGGSTPAGGATAPSTLSSSVPSAKSTCRTSGPSPTSPSSRRSRTRARPKPSPLSEPSSFLTAPTSSSATHR